MYNPLDDRYIGSVCEIRSFSNDILAVGVIAELGDDYIKIGARDSQIMLFSTSTKIKLNIFNSKAGFTVLICEVLTSTSKELKVVEPMRIIDHERRKGFRVEVDLTATVSYENNFDTIDNPEKLRIVWIKDLSICGLRLNTNWKFILGQLAWMNIKLEDQSIITKVQIIRVSEEIIVTDDGEELREYGAKFMFDKAEDNDKLCSYLFKRQRELSRKIR